MMTPTKTVNKNANIGFCSFTIRAKNVVINPKPTIWIISMAQHLPY